MLPIDQAPGGWGPARGWTLKEGFGGAFFGGNYSAGFEEEDESAEQPDAPSSTAAWAENFINKAVPNPFNQFLENSGGASQTTQVTVGYNLSYAQLPVSGPGFYTFDDRREHYGSGNVIGQLIGFAASLNQLHPDHPIGFGHISSETGVQIHNHSSHNNGLHVDIRPMRFDGRPLQTRVGHSSYNQRLTIELIRGLRTLTGFRFMYFNDSTTIKMGLTTYYKKHWDHLHVAFRF